MSDDGCLELLELALDQPPPNPCARCMTEAARLAGPLRYAFVYPAEADRPWHRPLCRGHILETPSVLLEPVDNSRLTVEMESARQWSVALGRGVDAFERVDAIGYLQAMGEQQCHPA